MIEDNKPDVLRMFFGYPYQLTDEISISQPTVRDVVEFGEDKFWGFVTRFAGNPTSMRLPLWDAGIDWNKITDFELFVSLVHSFKPEETKMFFGDQLDFTKFVPIMVPVVEEEEVEEKTEEKEELKTEIILMNEARPEIQINEELYTKMIRFIRMSTGYDPKVEKAKGKLTKQNIIDEERMNNRIAEMKRKKEPLYGSFFLPLFSFCLNYAGFKYKKLELLDMTIFEFMDSVRRILNTEGVKSLMSGMYSGFMDTSKLNLSKDVNFTKDLYESK